MISLIAGLALLFTLMAGTWTNAAAAGLQSNSVNFVIPTISIVSVVTDTSVTIKTANYPANDTYNVYMNHIGTRGIGGIKVDTINSGSGGSFEKTFTIPDSLKGLAQIAIRLESPTSGYYSYDWFNNKTGGTTPGTGTGGPYTSIIPTISITSVDVDNKVTIQTQNYPANDTFKVLMGHFGTRGIGGITVDTVNSGAGGSLSFTFSIPNELKGLAQIAIRLESSTSGYFSYNWFNNKTGGAIPNTGGTYPTGLTPSFVITGVSANNTITIKTSNFPANDTFNIYMGNYGTRGIGGASAGSVNSGSGGTQTFTLTIPDAVKGKAQIAVRLESPSSGYFSYNWFYNNTYP